jgi:hypothetical protein
LRFCFEETKARASPNASVSGSASERKFGRRRAFKTTTELEFMHGSPSPLDALLDATV